MEHLIAWNDMGDLPIDPPSCLKKPLGPPNGTLGLPRACRAPAALRTLGALRFWEMSSQVSKLLQTSFTWNSIQYNGMGYHGIAWNSME